MKQSQIMKLLVEASNIYIDKNFNNQQFLNENEAYRINEIQLLLTKDVCKFKDSLHGKSNSQITEHYISCLYIETLHGKPEYLPKLFPVFAMLCGDKEQSSYGDKYNTADIEWGLVI